MVWRRRMMEMITYILRPQVDIGAPFGNFNSSRKVIPWVSTETPESLRIIFAEELLECIKKGPLVRVRKVKLRGFIPHRGVVKLIWSYSSISGEKPVGWPYVS